MTAMTDYTTTHDIQTTPKKGFAAKMMASMVDTPTRREQQSNENEGEQQKDGSSNPTTPLKQLDKLHESAPPVVPFALSTSSLPHTTLHTPFPATDSISSSSQPYPQPSSFWPSNAVKEAPRLPLFPPVGTFYAPPYYPPPQSYMWQYPYSTLESASLPERSSTTETSPSSSTILPGPPPSAPFYFLPPGYGCCPPYFPHPYPYIATSPPFPAPTNGGHLVMPQHLAMPISSSFHAPSLPSLSSTSNKTETLQEPHTSFSSSSSIQSPSYSALFGNTDPNFAPSSASSLLLPITTTIPTQTQQQSLDQTKETSETSQTNNLNVITKVNHEVNGDQVQKSVKNFRQIGNLDLAANLPLQELDAVRAAKSIKAMLLEYDTSLPTELNAAIESDDEANNSHPRVENLASSAASNPRPPSTEESKPSRKRRQSMKTSASLKSNSEQETSESASGNGNASSKKRSAIVKTSVFRGVSACGRDRKFQARIRLGNNVMYLGRFATELEAALRYDDAVRHYGDQKLSYPTTNFRLLEQSQKDALLEHYLANDNAIRPEFHHFFQPETLRKYLAAGIPSS